jgi:hypothetical protein
VGFDVALRLPAVRDASVCAISHDSGRGRSRPLPLNAYCNDRHRLCVTIPVNLESVLTKLYDLWEETLMDLLSLLLIKRLANCMWKLGNILSELRKTRRDDSMFIQTYLCA